ncbi:MAG TPA: caspase family protein [Polyangia bacterium]|nr:caspase family protein [Polyangia bacterium]
MSARRAAVALGLGCALAACAGGAAGGRAVEINNAIGLSMSVQGGDHHYDHPAQVSEAAVKSALRSDGSLVEAQITGVQAEVARELARLEPSQRIEIKTSSAVLLLYVQGGALNIVRVDGGSEGQATRYALGEVEQGHTIPAPIVSAPAPTAPVAAAPESTTPERRPVRAAGQPQNLALVIGIEQYRDLPRVDHARADSERVAAHMRDVLDIPEDRIALLTDAHATLNDINKYLDGWVPSHARGANRLYFYFAGHGSPELTSGAAHLLPYDGDPRYLKQTAIDMNDLYRRLQASGVTEVVVMLDACFSGTGGRSVLPKGARPLVVVNAPKVVPPSLLVLSAAGATQTTGPHPKAPSGLFTYYLIEGLQGAADADGDGQITANELLRYVQPRVEREARHENRDQSPELRGAKMDLVLEAGVRAR